MLTPRPVRDSVYGVVMIGALALLLVLVIAFYNQAFTPLAQVTVRTDRSGLLMNPGARVKMDGVDLGEVSDVRLRQDGEAELVLELLPERMDQVPANVKADINASTAFGPKVVELQSPDAPARRPLQDGAAIEAAHHTVEVNTVFEHLTQVLDTARPSQVNATLHALAGALEGNGDRIGITAVSARRYLAKLNTDLPALQRDMRALADVANLYADVSPALLRTLDNASVTSRTMVVEAAALRRFLRDFTALGSQARRVLLETGDALVVLLDVLEPSTSLFAAYSPGLTCFIEGLDHARKGLERALAGDNPAGWRILMTFLPPAERYRYARDLPEVGAAGGPDCHGLPVLDADERPAPYVPYPGTGTSVSPDERNYYQVGDEPPIVRLFGPLSAPARPR